MVIVLNRDELDKQIEGVFIDAGEKYKRTSSGQDLLNLLSHAKPRLICSLIHKFGRRMADDFNAFIRDLKSQPSKTVGDRTIFVDECHRTQER
ncbi:MAG: hypothetical protein R2741_03530 [Methanolobus sp.]